MRPFFWFWTAVLFIKILLAGFLPLSPDEAYYWFWTKYPQLSYFDHPPFVAWLFQVGNIFREFYSFIRLPAVVFLHCSFWLWILIWKDKLDHETLWRWTLLWSFNPLTGLGAIIVTPDLPLMFFWPLATLSLLRLNETRSFIWAAVFGMSLGFGFCSKYHMALFGILSLIWLIAEKHLSWKDWPLLLTVLVFFIFSSFPVWLWNWNNNFVSFQFQLQHGLGSARWRPFWTWSYVIGQVALIFPIVFWLSIKNLKIKKHPLWLIVLAFGPLLFFLLSSFRGKVEANWPIVAYPFIFVFTAKEISAKLLKLTLFCWMAVFLFLLINISPMSKSWLSKDWSLTKIKEINQIDEMVNITRNYRPLFVYSYQMAAKMSFLLHEDIYKLQGSGRVDFFDGLELSIPRGDLFYFLSPKEGSLPVHFERDFIISETIHLNEKFDLLKMKRIKEKN